MLISLKQAQGKPTPLFYSVVVLLLVLNIIPVLRFFPMLPYMTIGSGPLSAFLYVVAPFIAMANIPIFGYLLFRQVSTGIKVASGALIVASIIYLILIALGSL